MNAAQADANQLAEDAIAALVSAYDLLDPEFVVTSWVVVLASEHANRPRETGYAHAYSGGHMAVHHSIGLLTIALDQISNGDDEEDED